ncbi:NAD(P)H-binding protein [Niastella populi]|uniref:NAD-dependent dehydratase n=1 Tax=Niastella populi TaxID=550983 RepID=A0A1V9EYH3_9BACT|nr:NAD(P)H-binding protein [Niastella populi]OQP51190.1 NAD-dependent dehydratase [Niastella populi]
MKYTVTGSLGNISKHIVDILVKNGHDVTVISSNPQKQTAIEALGAKAAIGSVTDAAFLTNAFKGADAVYTMVPPDFTKSDYRQHMADTGKNYLGAIKASGVKRVVNLSSIGAHLSAGTGPIAGLHEVEQLLNTLDGVAIKHLRPGFFYTNFFFDVAVIRNHGIMGSNYSADSKLSMVHPKDIAVVAAQELQTAFEGKSHEYIVSDERKMAEVAQTLGAAIGKPELPWVTISDEQLLGGMTGAGMGDSIARLYVEMGHAIGKGILFEDFHKQPEFAGKTKLTDFANEFAAVYNSNQ